VSFINQSIDFCSDEKQCPYHSQCLIIFQHSTSTITIHSDGSSSSTRSGKSRLTVCEYFNEFKVDDISIVERPLDSCQVYIAGDLGCNYHFSCPTTQVYNLVNIIKQKHNINVNVLFVPRSCKLYESNGLTVVNYIISNNPITSNANDKFDLIYETICKESSGGASHRSSDSISIGLQTMYSHQQHLSRYCMLPHSMPHVPMVKQYNHTLRKTIIECYLFACEVLATTSRFRDKHPFLIDTIMSGNKLSRKTLRNDLYIHIIGEEEAASEKKFVCEEEMFESCSIQPMGKLGFHKDTMNCPSMDRTIAVHIPNKNGDQCDKKCLSFLYYSRKCVGDFDMRQNKISRYINNGQSCLLTRLCLKSILETNGIFNYQGSIFEHTSSLNKLGAKFEKNVDFACPDVVRFTGLVCFRHGAAFDKMGYYSLLLNVFLSMFYMGIIKTIDDSISLCIYFGLVCNGTSNLAATWSSLCKQEKFAKDWVQKKTTAMKVFKLLVFLEKQRRETNKSFDSMGSSRMPRYQYSGYSMDVISDADVIHCYVKDFLVRRSEQRPASINVRNDHSKLFASLSSIKGVGPLSFNQFWHSLCLCGVLPIHYIHTTGIAVGSGSAKLIQTYYPECKCADSMTHIMHKVKSAIINMGINTLTDFFLNKSKLATTKMSPKD